MVFFWRATVCTSAWRDCFASCKRGFKWNGHLADGALCISISALSLLCPLCFLSCSTPEPLGRYRWWEQCMLGSCMWSCEGLVSIGEEGQWLCCSSWPPAANSSLLSAFRSFRVCSAGYCRFINLNGWNTMPGRRGVMAELEPRLQPNNHWQTKKPQSDKLQIPTIPPAVYLCKLTSHWYRHS